MLYSLVIVTAMLFGLNSYLGAFGGTCTMGNDSRFVLSAALNMVLLIPILAMLWGASKSTLIRSSVMTRLMACSLMGISLFVMSIWLPLFWNVFIEGSHLCGDGYNKYLDGGYMIEKLAILFNIMMASILLIVGSRRMVK